MKVKYDHKTLRLSAETEQEKGLLASNYLKTKLAYTEAEGNDDGLTISIGGTKCYLDLEANEALIGHESLTDDRISYLLRVVLDAYVLKRGDLPLHSSLLSSEDRSAFLFGGTNCGKSVFAHQIEEMAPNCKVVGDDHIIVSPQGFIGNSIFRVRSKDKEYYSYLKNPDLFHKRTKYYIFDININDKMENSKILSSGEYMQSDLTHVLKYLIYDFKTESGILKIDDIIKGGIKSEYLNQFENFIRNAIAIIKIRGHINYVVKSIYDMLTVK